MNSFERKALMIRRKKLYRRRMIILVTILCIIISLTVFTLIRTIIIPPNEEKEELILTEILKDMSVDNYNRYFQPLDLSIDYYLEEKYKPAISHIKLIEDNASVVDIEAEYSVVIDAANNTVLYNKNGNLKCYPASTTKILTALVALESCGNDFIIEVGNEIDMIKEGSTIAYLQKGTRLTVKMLIDGLLLPSGNDAAYTIAVNVAKDINPNPKLTDSMAVDLFCELMNAKAKSVGATETNFVVPDGYHEENHYTTAYDMGLIAYEALKNTTLKETVSKASSRNILVTGQDVTWNNTNMLLQRGGPYYYEYASGIKTGTNDESGNCLLSYAEKDGKKLITVVMNSTPSGRWNDTIKLFEYFFAM